MLGLFLFGFGLGNFLNLFTTGTLVFSVLCPTFTSFDFAHLLLLSKNLLRITARLYLIPDCRNLSVNISQVTDASINL